MSIQGVHSSELLTVCQDHAKDKQTIFTFYSSTCSLHLELTEKAGEEERKVSAEKWNLLIYFKFLQTSVDEFTGKSLCMAE